MVGQASTPVLLMVHYFIHEGGNSFYSTRNTQIKTIPGVAIILIGADTLGFARRSTIG